jgi:hypothetical protein
MAADNTLSLIVTADTSQANKAVDQFNRGLSVTEKSAVQTGRAASRGLDDISASALRASRGMDGMASTMGKGVAAGTLLADTLKKAITWAKNYAIEAAQMAAHEERLEASTKALAAAHDVSNEAMKKAVEQIERVGFESEDAMHAVNRLMISDLGLEKAQGLAKLAKDAAAIENISAPEALEKLLLAIESGASRGLRSMGLFVDLQKKVTLEELRLGKTLSETEAAKVRYNAVMAEGAKFEGTAAAAAKTAEGQMKAFGREVDHLKKAIGREFQDQFVAIAGHLRTVVHWATENSTAFARLGEAAIVLSTILVGTGLALKIAKIAQALSLLPIGTIKTIAFAISNNLTGALVGAEAVLYNVLRLVPAVGVGLGVWWAGNTLLKHKQGNKELDTTAEAIKKINDRLKETPEWWIQRGMTPPKTEKDRILEYVKSIDANKTPTKKPEPTEDEIRRMAAIRKAQAEAGRSAQELYLRAVEERKDAEREMAKGRIEDSMRLIEATESETEAARQSLEVLLLSRQEYEAGIAKIREEERREITRLSTRVDEKTGNVERFALKPETLERIHQATAQQIAAFDLRFNQEEARRLDQMWKAFAARQQKFIEEYIFGPVKQDLEVWEQASQLDDRRKDQQLTNEKAAVQQRRDLALAELDTVDAYTLRDKVAVEAAKTKIEVDAIRERTRIEIEEIDRRTEYDIREAERAMLAKGIFDDDGRLDQIRSRIRQLGAEEKSAIERSATNEVQIAQTKGAADTRRIVVDHYRQMFDSLKQQAGGVFDALLTKSQSVFSAIGNALKTAVLTAIKDVVTSRVAAMLMQLFAGQQVGFARGGNGGGGLLGRVGGFLGIGAVPVYGGTGGGGVLGGPVNGNPMILSAAGGGTPGASVATAAGGGLFSKAGWAGSLAGLKEFLGFGGGVQYAPGMATTWEAATLGQKLSALGRSNAALMGGALLALDGIRRGGITGMAETTAGGALIGYKYGGGLGAAIGAGIGALAGLVGLFRKSAEEKAHEKIRATYGVDIKDKGVLKQIVETAKQTFGGNLDMAIRSQQIRDLVELYALSTGQSTSGLPGTVKPVSWVSQGGTMFSQSVSGGSTVLDRIGGGTAQNAGAVVIGSLTLQVEGKSAADVLEGRIADKPRVVQSAVLSANRSNYGRRETAAQMFSPGLLTA